MPASHIINYQSYFNPFLCFLLQYLYQGIADVVLIKNIILKVNEVLCLLQFCNYRSKSLIAVVKNTNIIPMRNYGIGIIEQKTDDIPFGENTGVYQQITV